MNAMLDRLVGAECGKKLLTNDWLRVFGGLFGKSAGKGWAAIPWEALEGMFGWLSVAFGGKRSGCDDVVLLLRMLGLLVVVIGSLAKIPQVAGMVKQMRRKGAWRPQVMMLPMAAEAAGLAVVVAFHLRLGTVLSAWGESVMMLLLDGAMGWMEVFGRMSSGEAKSDLKKQQQKTDRSNKKTDSAPKKTATGGAVDALWWAAAMVAMASPAAAITLASERVPIQTLEMVLDWIVPFLFVGGGLYVVVANGMRGTAGGIDRRVAVLGAVSGWLRAASAWNDVGWAVRAPMVAGAALATIIVVQAA